MAKKRVRTGDLTIVERKIQAGYRLKKNEFVLGRVKHWENLIEIDPRQNSEELMDTVIHECLHYLNPDWTEKKVIQNSTIISEVLWGLKFRRIKD